MRHLKLVHSIEAEYPMDIRIAFASADRKSVDQHFGAAEAFVIYALSGKESRLMEAVQFHDSDTAMDGHEGKLAAKIGLLHGCAAVYCNAVGASAIKQLLAAGIQPMKVPEGTAIEALLDSLGQSLTEHPPAWLQKARDPRDSRRFEIMDAEGWSE